MGAFVKKKMWNKAGEGHYDADYPYGFAIIPQQHHDGAYNQKYIPQFSRFLYRHFAASADLDLPRWYFTIKANPVPAGSLKSTNQQLLALI